VKHRFTRYAFWQNISLKTEIIGLLTLVSLTLLMIFILWTYQVQKAQTKAELLEETRVLVNEMYAVWDFISINQDTINYNFSGNLEYKGIHCAIAGKSVAALFSQNSEYSIRFTKTEPRNIYNSPDEYEEEALATFSSKTPDSNEYYGFSEYQGQSVFRYVSAMEVTSNCTDCHGKPMGEKDITGYPKEGWEVGDIAGAVSVIVPTSLYFQNMQQAVISNVLFFLLIMLCMVVLIYFALTRLITKPLTHLQSSFAHIEGGAPTSAPTSDLNRYSSKEMVELFSQFNSMVDSLDSLYADLESRVKERTAQLSEANKELERQRLHIEEVNQKLQQDNQYKSDFLAIVSHELKTPLTSILAFCELMVENIDTKDLRVQKQLAEIDKNSNILLEMVNNILETARIQAGSEKINLELTDLSDIIGIVEASSISLAEKKQITLVAKVSPSVPLIMTDWEKVRRIILNLVSNAIKFTPDGGTINVLADLSADEREVIIRVIDNGIGIPDDKQELIFERFTQENMSTVRRFGGSGLGLSLVRDLTTMLGGFVAVKSSVGKGSDFTVTLPVGNNNVEKISANNINADDAVSGNINTCDTYDANVAINADDTAANNISAADADADKTNTADENNYFINVSKKESE
jgi:signal transduction histidine kinase